MVLSHLIEQRTIYSFMKGVLTGSVLNNILIALLLSNVVSNCVPFSVLSVKGLEKVHNLTPHLIEQRTL